MIPITLHPDTPPQHPPATATLSAPAVDTVASRTDGDELLNTKTPGHAGSMRDKP